MERKESTSVDAPETGSSPETRENHQQPLAEEDSAEVENVSRQKLVLDPRVEYSEFSVHVVTWNIASTQPSSHDIESLFLPQESCMLSDILPSTDIIVVGLQEAYQSIPDAVQSSVPMVGKDPLVELFSNFLCLNGFVRLSTSRLLGILTLVFVKRPLVCYISDLESCTTKTGMSGWLGNKGASSIRFSLGDVSVCFTNCHLVPHPENNLLRVQELRDIFAKQVFSSNPSKPMDHDILVLFGDLNFRLEGKSLEEVSSLLKQGQRDLLKYDQLRLEQMKGDSSPSRLYGFVEMSIPFVPSYKYEPGTDSFDGGTKQRAPAWCDRILWRTHERRLPRITDPEPRSILTHKHYSIHMQPRISDHKAVSGGLVISVNLSGFIPQVVFNIMTEWVAGKEGLISFEMEANTEISMFDWIGLYPENFANLEKDYVFWIFTPVRGKVLKRQKYSRVLVREQVPSEPGRYLLLYKSSQYNRVLGMSPIFPIR